ncbi:MAG: AAA family ATPase [Bacteroidetes bacterium]|nr:AAA family ATPase [Bacteroidota bacterium]
MKNEKTGTETKTLLELIHSVSNRQDVSEDFGIDGVFLLDDDEEESKAALAERLGMTVEEAAVFAVLFAMTLEDGEINTNQIARKLNYTLARYDELTAILNRLHEKGLVFRCYDFRNRYSYIVGPEIQSRIFGNKDVLGMELKTDAFGLADIVASYFKLLREEKMEADIIYKYLIKLTEINPSLPISKTIEKYLLSEEEVVLLFALYCNKIEGYRSLSMSSYLSDVYRKYAQRRNIKKMFLLGNAKTLETGLVNLEDDHFQVGDSIRLTEAGLEALFGNDKSLFEKNEHASAFPEMINPAGLPERKLFFNPSEKEAVDSLQRLLSEAEFPVIQKNLSAEGMIPGMAILLYGAPGTGKTETVYQSARNTGRELFKVEISSIRDKYVGESEKRTRKIFNDYRRCMKKPGPMPILFLNEADALISNRITVSDSVDQMNNTMQNILLEEMERFEGILFCTTNLEVNLDPAFERRFLYKIKFELPSETVRAAILRDRLKNLSEEQALRLSSLYPLSGGQVDNIHRKLVTERLLSGTEPTIEFIEKICAQESILRKSSRKIIGGFHTPGN